MQRCLFSHSYPRLIALPFVPVSAARRKERGYNQAQLVAAELGRCTGLPVENLLLVGKSGNQKTMHYNERFLNILGRFTASDDYDCTGKGFFLLMTCLQQEPQ